MPPVLGDSPEIVWLATARGARINKVNQRILLHHFYGR
jgi:hypothetical protein